MTAIGLCYTLTMALAGAGVSLHIPSSVAHSMQGTGYRYCPAASRQQACNKAESHTELQLLRIHLLKLADLLEV